MIPSPPEPVTPESPIRTPDDPDATIVCFCYRKTLGDLRREHAKFGSLARLQEMTRAGLCCGGCRALLHYHFGEDPLEMNDLSDDPRRGATACVKPGNRTMKCFITSSSLLESRAFSCNGVPPQLGTCDSSMTVEFTIHNHLGRAVLSRSQRVSTGETFVFDTAAERLPRPFHGMIAYRLNRQNYGASRLNVAWYAGDSCTVTHENFSTGRPDVVLPVPVDRQFLRGPNCIYLAVQNPHSHACVVRFRVFPLSGGDGFGEPLPVAAANPRRFWRLRPPQGAFETRRTLPALGTLWINANDEIYSPALAFLGDRASVLRIHATGGNIHEAPSTYFFLHHRGEKIWSSNHL